MNSSPHSPARVWTVGTLTYTLSGLVTLFFLLLFGDFAWSLKERSVFQIVQLLFKTHGASDTMNGIFIMSLPAALGIFLGPVVAYRSDRCRSRRGRRIPYLLYTTPVAAGAMAGLAASPAIGRWIAGQTGFAADPTILILLGLFWTVFEFATVIAGTLFGALVNDVVPQPLLGRFYGLFRALSLLAGILFNYFLLGFAATHFDWLFVGIALIYGIGFTIMCLKVKEGEYPPPEPVAGSGRLAAIREYLREAYAKPYYLLLFAFTALAGMAMSPVTCYSLFYSQSLGVPIDHYGKAIALTYTVSLVLSWPLGVLADKFHPLRVAIATMFAYAVSSAFGYWLVKDEGTFLTFFVINTILGGIYVTGSASLLQRLLPRGNFATLGSAGGIIGSMLYMVTVPGVGLFLDWSEHRYCYTFLLGCIFCTVTGVVGLVFYREFRKRGGPDAYQAP